jgi:hypothetical protein
MIFHAFIGIACCQRAGALLHLTCTPRVHPVRGKGISHLAGQLDPTFTLFCPTLRTTGDKEEVNYAYSRTTRPPQP